MAYRSSSANGSFKTGDYWQIPARTATASIEWPFTTPQPTRGVLHHYARLAFLRLKDDGTPQAPPQDARRIFLPLTPSPLALHVKGINWPNDDFVALETLTQSNVGLRILLDSPFRPSTVNASTMVVTLETVLPATPPNPNSFLHVNTILAGQITLDPSVQANPDPAVIRTIVWKLPPAFGELNALLTQAVDPPQVRVRLRGSAIWSEDGAQVRYLDGHAYGRAGQRADDKSFRVDLRLPSGTDALASDFESWFFLKKIIPPAALIGLTLTPAKVVAGGTGLGVVKLDRAALADTTISLTLTNLTTPAEQVGSIPASVVIPAGKGEVEFKFATSETLGRTSQARIEAKARRLYCIRRSGRRGSQCKRNASASVSVHQPSTAILCCGLGDRQYCGDLERGAGRWRQRNHYRHLYCTEQRRHVPGDRHQRSG